MIEIRNINDFQILCSFVLLDEIAMEALPGLAREALCVGIDSPTLAILAGQTSVSAFDLRALFEKCMKELGLSYQKQDDAALAIARYYAQLIVEGKMTPFDGASTIWSKAYYHLENYHLLTPFVGLADDYGDSLQFSQKRAGDAYDKAKLDELDQLIIREAKNILKVDAGSA